MTLIHSSHQESLLVAAARPSALQTVTTTGVKKGKLNLITIEITENELPQFLRLTRLFQKSIQQCNIHFVIQITPSLPKNIGAEAPTSLEIQRVAENTLQIVSERPVPQRTPLTITEVTDSAQVSPSSSSSSSSSSQIVHVQACAPRPPLLATLKPFVACSQKLARYLTMHTCVHLAEFRSEIDNLLTASTHPQFRALKGHSDITLCSCCNCMKNGKTETTSSFGGTDRTDFTVALLKKVLRVFTDPSTPLKIASLGSGGCLHELLIHATLNALGYTNIEWTLTDTHFATSEGRRTAQEFTRLATHIMPNTRVTIGTESPEDFVQNTSNKHNVLVMIHNDASNSEVNTRRQWTGIADPLHVRGTLTLAYLEEVQSRFKIGGEITQVRPLRLLNRADQERLLDDFIRVLSGVHVAFDDFAARGLVNATGVIVPLSRNPARDGFLRAITQYFDIDRGDSDVGLPMIMRGIPQIYRPSSDGTIEQGSAWLLMILTQIIREKSDKSSPLVLKSRNSEGYLNEVLMHLLLLKLGYENIQWILDEATSPLDHESQRIFRVLLNSFLKEGDACSENSEACTIIPREQAQSLSKQPLTADFEIDTVRASVITCKKASSTALDLAHMKPKRAEETSRN